MIQNQSLVSIDLQRRVVCNGTEGKSDETARDHHLFVVDTWQGDLGWESPADPRNSRSLEGDLPANNTLSCAQEAATLLAVLRSSILSSAESMSNVKDVLSGVADTGWEYIQPYWQDRIR